MDIKMASLKTKLLEKKSAIKKAVMVFITGCIVMYVVGHLYDKYIVLNLIEKSREAESYILDEYYINLIDNFLFWDFIVSTFSGCVVIGFMIGKGGWKFAAISSILIFLLLHLPGMIYFNTLILSSILIIPFGTLGGAIGTQLKMRTGKLA